MGEKILEIYDESGRMVVKQILPPKKESWLSELVVGGLLGLVLFVLLLTCMKEYKMCECKCECRKSTKTTGRVFNPWPEQKYVFFGNVFARKEDVKPGEKSLIVTQRCRVA